MDVCDECDPRAEETHVETEGDRAGYNLWPDDMRELITKELQTFQGLPYKRIRKGKTLFSKCGSVDFTSRYILGYGEKLFGLSAHSITF